MMDLEHHSGNTASPEMATRDAMKKYWQVYEPSLESMMLSHDARYLAENEQNEILSCLPDYAGANVLELGAGIGRFTSRLAQLAGHVTTVDFMESYVQENQKNNSQFQNISYKCADVTKLDLEDSSFDLIYSNWLLMYLTNTETEALIQRVLRWLKPGGFFFFRESCYHPSGNVKRLENPTKYRTPLEYINILSRASHDKNIFALVSAKNVLTYVCYHGNPNQLCILVKKESRATIKADAVGDSALIEQRRQLYGPLWTMVVHDKQIVDTCTDIGLRSGQRVLSLLSETGDVAFLLAKNFNVFVHGVDESADKLHLSIVQQGKQDADTKKKIQFEASPLERIKLPTESYDLIVSFDRIANRTDSRCVLSSLKKWLKPKGRIYITDYFRTEQNTNIPNKLNKRVTLEQTTQILTETDFKMETLSDDTNSAQEHLSQLLKTIQNEAKHNDLSTDIMEKMEKLSSGQWKWCQIVASTN